MTFAMIAILLLARSWPTYAKWGKEFASLPPMRRAADGQDAVHRPSLDGKADRGRGRPGGAL